MQSYFPSAARRAINEIPVNCLTAASGFIRCNRLPKPPTELFRLPDSPLQICKLSRTHFCRFRDKLCGIQPRRDGSKIIWECSQEHFTSHLSSNSTSFPCPSYVGIPEYLNNQRWTNTEVTWVDFIDDPAASANKYQLPAVAWISTRMIGARSTFFSRKK